MMFAYNTSIHSSTRFSPAFLTFGFEPRNPLFPSTDLHRRFYGEQDVDDFQRRLLVARQLAAANNESNRTLYENQYNKQVKPNIFHIGQKVLLSDATSLHKNRKLSPKFSGPHTISRLIHDTNAEIIMAHNNRKVIVHLNRLKPYLYSLPEVSHSPAQEIDSTSVPVKPPVPPTPPRPARGLVDNAPAPVDHSDSEDFPHFNPLSVFKRGFSDSQNSVLPSLPKRGRGRPPKQKFSVNGGDNVNNSNGSKVNPQTFTSEDNSQNLINDNPTIELETSTPERRITRSMVAQAGSVINAIIETYGTQQSKKEERARKRLHQRNFRQTGDMFGDLLQCNGTFGVQPHQPGAPQDDEVVEQSSDESGGSEYDTGESEDDGEEVSEGETGSDSPEEQVPIVHQPQPQTQTRNMLPLPATQLSNVLPPGQGFRTPTTGSQPASGGKKQSATTTKEMPQHSTPTPSTSAQAEPSISKLPSSRGVSSRIRPYPPPHLSPSTVHTRRTATKEISGQRDPETKRGMEESGKDAEARPKAPASIPTTRPHQTGSQEKDSSNVSQAGNSTLQTQDPLGQVTNDLTTFNNLLMEFVSLRNAKAEQPKLQAAANNLGRFLATASTRIEVEQTRSSCGIDPDDVIHAIFKKAHHYRDQK